jgi:hypothetical protein
MSVKLESAKKNENSQNEDARRTARTNKEHPHFASDIRIGSPEENAMFERQKERGVRLKSLYDNL